MARTAHCPTIGRARNAIASLDDADPGRIADYVIASFTTSGDVEIHTSLCCAGHARWLLSSVEFTDDQCDMTGE